MALHEQSVGATSEWYMGPSTRRAHWRLHDVVPAEAQNDHFLPRLYVAKMRSSDLCSY
jgi:hypothetical protein